MAKSSFFNPYNLPWFIFDLSNLQLITTKTIPSDIADSKNIILAETPIPGLGYNPVHGGGMGNRRISMTIPIMNKNNSIGNLLLIKQFENLRNQAFGLNPQAIFNKSVQFSSNPKVLYYWGTGSGSPLVWWVAKCDFTHKSSLVNNFAYPQYTDVNLELVLDEQDPLTQAEAMFRKVASYAGILQGLGGI